MPRLYPLLPFTTCSAPPASTSRRPPTYLLEQGKLFGHVVLRGEAERLSQAPSSEALAFLSAWQVEHATATAATAAATAGAARLRVQSLEERLQMLDHRQQQQQEDGEQVVEKVDTTLQRHDDQLILAVQYMAGHDLTLAQLLADVLGLRQEHDALSLRVSGVELRQAVAEQTQGQQTGMLLQHQQNLFFLSTKVETLSEVGAGWAGR